MNHTKKVAVSVGAFHKQITPPKKSFMTCNDAACCFKAKKNSTCCRVENSNKPIRVGVASYLPLERSIKLLDKEDRKKIIIVGQEYKNADYLYSNLMSEVDKTNNDKYKIPNNFSKVSEFVIDGVKVYEMYKKIN